MTRPQPPDQYRPHLLDRSAADDTPHGTPPAAAASSQPPRGRNGRPDADSIPDGHYAVPSPDDPQRLTLWRVSAGRLLDWPDGTRWRPLPPPPPPDMPKADRRAWRQGWYDNVYCGWKAVVIGAIAADPDLAARRFRVEHGEVELPPPPPHKPRQARQARRRTKSPKPPRISPEARRRAAEQVAAVALRQLGRSYRQIAAEMHLPLTTVHRRLHSTTDPTATAAQLMARVADLETSLLASRVLHPEEVERIDQWLADLRTLVEALRTTGRP